MAKPFKPMLAKDARLDKVPYPVLVQPKLDGIRCSIVNGKAVARSLKPIPNEEIRKYLEREEFNGLDGELIVGSPMADDAYNRSVSFVMSRSKTGAAWSFYVFDLWDEGELEFEARDVLLASDVQDNFGCDRWGGDHSQRIQKVNCAPARNEEELLAIERRMVEDGFEGVILRDPSAAYKFGRSGVRGPLLKLKRFVDGEAVIVGAEEKMHNANVARTNELGRTERSTAKAGLVPTGTLGSLLVEDVETGTLFSIGTGFNDATRAELWDQYTKATDEPPLIGRTVKYKSFPVGVKDRPRFPVFLGFRDMEIDG